jgi:hypothetical protein
MFLHFVQPKTLNLPLFYAHHKILQHPQTLDYHLLLVRNLVHYMQKLFKAANELYNTWTILPCFPFLNSSSHSALAHLTKFRYNLSEN